MYNKKRNIHHSETLYPFELYWQKVIWYRGIENFFNVKLTRWPTKISWRSLALFWQLCDCAEGKNHRTMQRTTQACWLIWIMKIFLSFKKTIYPFPFLWQGLNWWKSGRKTLGWLLRGGSCRDMLSKTEISVKKICDWSKNYVLSWLSNESTCWMNARGD